MNSIETAGMSGHAARPAYTIGKKLGEGTFGKVYQAQKDSADGEEVALKVFNAADEEGLDPTLIREIAALHELEKHKAPHVVHIMATQMIFMSEIPQMALAMELCACDLKRFLKTRVVTTLARVTLVAHLLRGMEAMHNLGFIHRDLKPQNLLIDRAEQQLKICDMGLARPHAANEDERTYTLEAVTLWYRPMELLLGQTTYGRAVDMWSLGLVVVEIATGRPLLPGDSEIGQVMLILMFMGRPTEETWPAYATMPLYKDSLPRPKPLREPKWPTELAKDARLQEVASRCLRYDPRSRATCELLLPMFAYIPLVPTKKLQDI